MLRGTAKFVLMSAQIKRAVAILFLILIVCTAKAAAQGCSDAGFCTAGAMQSGQTHDNAATSSRIGISVSAGAGENGTSIIIPQLEADVALGKRGVAEIRLPFSIASGNLGDHSGIGDPIFSYTRQLNKHGERWTIQYTLGCRISTGHADAKNENDQPLPMPYQSNLGTTDVIAGISAGYGRYLNLSAGYQQPLLQYNNNGYLPVTIYPAIPGDHDYFASANLKRRGDVLFRTEGHCQWKKLGIAAGPLLIYHLGKDDITLANGAHIALNGSEGLTLNLAGTISYTAGKYKLSLTGGTPMIVRDYRPDGLTRAWVTTIKVVRAR